MQVGVRNYSRTAYNATVSACAFHRQRTLTFLNNYVKIRGDTMLQINKIAVDEYFNNGFISLHLMSKLNDLDEETDLYFDERVLQENSENKIFIG